MRRLVEANFSLTLLAFALLGLFVPGIAGLPTSLVVACLAGVIFTACFKLRFDELGHLDWWGFARFFGLRFVLLPALLYLAMQRLLPSFVLPIFLLALAPPATSSPALSHLLGGHISLAFALTVIGNLLSLVLLPLGLGLLAASSVHLDQWSAQTPPFRSPLGRGGSIAPNCRGS